MYAVLTPILVIHCAVNKEACAARMQQQGPHRTDHGWCCKLTSDDDAVKITIDVDAIRAADDRSETEKVGKRRHGSVFNAEVALAE